MPRNFLAQCAAAALIAMAAVPAGSNGTSTLRAPDAPSVAGDADSSPAGVERGRYLVAAGDCISCHTRPGGSPFTGGLAFSTPFGTIYSTNITPDDETGIGKWTADDLRHAMHDGVTPAGQYLFPAFPYTSFTKVTDADVDAIYVYLRSLKTERSSPPANGALFSQRWPMSVWNRLFFRAGRFAPNASKSKEWNRGAYIVEGLGHCGACHTPRNLFFAETPSGAYSGGAIQAEVDGGKIRRWSSVNLTPAKNGLAAWSVDNLTKYLASGFTPRAGTFGPMNDVIVHSLKQLTIEDVHAMAVYLKDLPAYEGSCSTVTADQVKAGAMIYKDRCEKCHSASGRGGIFAGPPLAGSAIVQSDDPASLINIILYGPVTPNEISFGGWESMKPYFDVLSDVEIAAVANYVRGSWDNRGCPVDIEEIARQR
jgi:alcohol dehydrogenase (quinone), cytochrome c subunit